MRKDEEKEMYKKICVIFVIILFCGCSIQREKRNAEVSEGNILEVEIERADYSVKSDSGKVIAEIYYEKPVVQGTSEAAEKMNQYFEKEKEEWFCGANWLAFYEEGRLQRFQEYLKNGIEIFGIEALEMHPFENVVKTEVVLNNNQYLSIMYVTKFAGGGPAGYGCFGNTFNVKTGERIPFDEMVDISSQEFREQLLAYMKKELYSFEEDELYQWEEFYEVYGEWDGETYEVSYYDLKIQMNYEYFYDGEYFYIILNEGTPSNPYLIKWNGEIGEKFVMSQVDYDELPLYAYE